MTPDQLVEAALPIAVSAALYRMWRDSRKTDVGEPVLPPMGKAGRIDRFWHPLIEPIAVGDAQTEFFETHMRMIAMSGGFKALDLDTPLPTPTGWITVGQVQAGDWLFDEHGDPTQVLGTSEVFTDRPCYEVVFSDGATIVADAEHRWLTVSEAARRSAYYAKKWDATRQPDGDWRDKRHKRILPSVVTTAEIAATLYAERSGRKALNHAVAIAGALHCPQAGLPLDPYVLGAWLGDGNSDSARITCSDNDLQVIREIESAGVSTRKQQGGLGRTAVYGLSYDGSSKAEMAVRLLRERLANGPCDSREILDLARQFGISRRTLVGALRPAGVNYRMRGHRGSLWSLSEPASPLLRTRRRHSKVQEALSALGVISNKHIPTVYARASVAQRLALLQGLMDTDGCCHQDGQSVFVTTRKKLADDVLALVSSLGIKASIYRYPCSGRSLETSTSYRVTFTTNLPVFRLPRKAERLPATVRATSGYRYISEVRPVPSRPTRCVMVDSPSHLFLAGREGIPTHNTTLLANLVRQRIEAGRPVVVLTGGDSDQLETEIRAHGGLVIRPENSPLKFNAFEGTPAFMSQSWAQLFPTNSTAKVYHGAFELAALDYFESTRNYSVDGLKDFVLDYKPKNAEGEEAKSRLYEGMKDGYVQIRLERVSRFLGDWIGDELSINDCIRHKLPVMFVVDSKDAPDLNELAAALVWQGMCYGVYQNGTSTGADLFVDEFGRLPKGLVSTAVRTFRRNQSHLVAASHTDRDFEDDGADILNDLFHVNVLGRMVGGATKTRSAASAMAWGTVHPTGFGPHALGDRRSRLDIVTKQPRKGYFWLVDQERVQQVKVFTYKPPKGYVEPVSPLKFAAKTSPHRFSGKLGGTGDGTAVNWKTARVRKFLAPAAEFETQAAASSGPSSEPGPVDGSRTPTGVGVRDVEAIAGRMHGPPVCPPIFLPPFATPRETKIWLQFRFPEGIEGDWEMDYYCNPTTGRPEMDWRGSPADPLRKKCATTCTRGHEHVLHDENRWMAYAVVKVLCDLHASGRPLGSTEAAAYIRRIRANTRSMKRTVGHTKKAGCNSIRCGKPEHLEWQTNRKNVAEQWEDYRAAHNRPKLVEKAG